MAGRGSRPTPLGWILGGVLLLALAALLHFTIGWRALLAPWAALAPAKLAVAFLLVVVSYAVRTARIHHYFIGWTRGRFGRSFRLVLLHNLFNNLLPMRSGEASFPILMSREFGVPARRSVPGLLFLRALDLHFLLLLGAAALATDRPRLGWPLLAALLPLPLLAPWLRVTVGRRVPSAESRVGRAMRAAFAGLPPGSGLFWATWLWTVVNWTVKLSVFAWLLAAFAPMPYATALLGSVTGELSSVLPAHGFAGAGTYEAGVMAGLVPMGVEVGDALAAAVNLHLFLLGISVVCGAAAAPFRGRRRMRTGAWDAARADPEA